MVQCLGQEKLGAKLGAKTWCLGTKFWGRKNLVLLGAKLGTWCIIVMSEITTKSEFLQCVIFVLINFFRKNGSYWIFAKSWWSYPFHYKSFFASYKSHLWHLKIDEKIKLPRILLFKVFWENVKTLVNRTWIWKFLIKIIANIFWGRIL